MEPVEMYRRATESVGKLCPPDGVTVKTVFLHEGGGNVVVRLDRDDGATCSFRVAAAEARLNTQDKLDDLVLARFRSHLELFYFE